MKCCVDVLRCSTCALLLAVNVSAQSIVIQDEMHKRVVELYNFSPHKLTDAGRSAKSAEMDVFWGDVKAHPDLELPLLRVELKNNSNPAFFMSDGSSLLLSLSNEPRDQVLAAEAMSHADLADVTSRAYFYAVHQLSMDGVDTTQAALHVLDDPKFSVPLPQHAMVLDQQSILLYLLLPVDQGKWMDAAQRRFADEKDETAQKSLLALFFYSQSKEGDLVINATVNDASKSEAIRKEARGYRNEVKSALKAK